MTCPEFREQIANSRGATLTERALAHAHVTQCAECQAERASSPLALGASPSAPTSPISLVTAARAARGTIRTELTQFLGVSTRLHVLTSGSLVVSTRAGARAIEATWGGLTWVAGRLPILVMLPARAVVGLVEGVRFACIRAARVVPPLGSAAMMACHGAVRAAAEAGGATLGLVSGAIGGTGRAAGRMALTCWLGVLRTRDVFLRVAGWVPSLAAPFARAVGHLVGTIPRLFEHARLAGARSARGLIRLGSAVMMACHGAARAVGDAAGVVLGLMWRSLAKAVRAAGWAVGGLVGTLPRLVERARLAGVRSARGLTRLGAAVMMACHGAVRAGGGAAGAILGLMWRSLAKTVRAAGWAVGRLAETIPGLVERARLAGARSARGLTRFGATVMVACHGAVRAVGGAAGAILGLAARSLSAAVRTAGLVATICWLGVLRTCDVVVRLGGRVPALVAPFARAGGRLVAAIPGVVEHVRFTWAGAARLVLRLGAAAMMACHGAARAASVPGGAVVGLVSRFLGESARAAGRVIAACWLGTLRIRDLFARLAGRVPALAASSARAVGHLVGTVPAGARAYPRVCAGIVSGMVLVSSLLLLGPRLRPDDLFSPGEEMLRNARLPIDRKPAEPSAATPVVATPVVVQGAPPRPAPMMPQPIPAPRVVAPEMRAAIPAPVRRSEPAAVDATAEASDPAAAIDWLLKGSARRRVETP